MTHPQGYRAFLLSLTRRVDAHIRNLHGPCTGDRKCKAVCEKQPIGQRWGLCIKSDNVRKDNHW